jgi:hypothetical protein
MQTEAGCQEPEGDGTLDSGIDAQHRVIQLIQRGAHRHQAPTGQEGHTVGARHHTMAATPSATRAHAWNSYSRACGCAVR